MIRIYLTLALVAILGLGVWGAKHYYDSSQEKIRALTENNVVLQVANTANLQTITQMAENSAAQQERISELDQRMEAAETYQDQLIKTLQDHDLTRLSMQKPGLIETRINDATQQIFAAIESDTAK
jgi:hypothetical protein